MKKIIKLITMGILMMTFVIVPARVQAESNSYEIFLTSNRKEVLKGEKFEITITVDNINVTTGQKGIGAYKAKINYDNAMFDMVEIKGLGNWEELIQNGNEIVATTKDGECVNTRQEIAIITFIAKTEISNITSVIKISDFKASDTENTIATEDKEIEVKVNSKSDNINEGNQENTDKNNSQQDDQDKKENNSIIKIPLPFTGRTVSINWEAVLILLIIIAVVIIVILLKKKHENE